MPWERGFAATVFGTTPAVQVLRISHEAKFLIDNRLAPVDADVVEPPAKVLKRSGAWTAVASRLTGVSWGNAEDTSRFRALMRWKTFVFLNVERTGLGRVLLQDLAALKSDKALFETIENVFASKSTKTLMKRSTDMARYFAWTAKMGADPLPIQARRVYNYMLHMIEEGQSSFSSECLQRKFELQSWYVADGRGQRCGC